MSPDRNVGRLLLSRRLGSGCKMIIVAADLQSCSKSTQQQGILLAADRSRAGMASTTTRSCRPARRSAEVVPETSPPSPFAFAISCDS